MWCRNVQRELAPYLDGRLDPKRESAVAAHLKGCRRCAVASEELRQLNALLDRQPETELPAQFEANVLRRIRTADAEAQSVAESRGWIWPLTAAACTAGLAMYLGWDAFLGDSRMEDPRRVALAPRPDQAPKAPVAVPGTAPPVIANAGVDQGGEAPEEEQRAAEKTLQAEGLQRAEDLLGEPPELLDQLDLFVDLPIIEDLERLENYESIWAGPDSEEQPTTRDG
jgi:anti-sigma factor RsiW